MATTTTDLRQVTDFHLATPLDVDRALWWHLWSFAELGCYGARFPSIGLSVAAVVETAEELPPHLQLVYLEEVIALLRRHVVGAIHIDPAPFDDAAGYEASITYPLREERLIVQGGRL